MLELHNTIANNDNITVSYLFGTHFFDYNIQEKKDHGHGQERTSQLAYVIPSEDLRVIRELGEGQYGVVELGEWKSPNGDKVSGSSSGGGGSEFPSSRTLYSRFLPPSSVAPPLCAFSM